MPGKHLTEAKEEERQRKFLQKITKGFRLAMFEGVKVLSTIRFLSKPGTRPAPLQKKGKESFAGDNEGNEGVPPRFVQRVQGPFNDSFPF
jgi:hypothetical protein